VVGTVTSTVLACRATLKLSETLDEIQSDLKDLEVLKLDIKNDGSPYTQEQYTKDMAYVYGKAAFKVTKLYGPSLIVGVAAMGALTGSHVQLSRRNTALMAAYATIQQAYNDYRDRVRDEVGEEKEFELYRGIKTDSFKNELDKKEETKLVDPNKWSPYAKFFDEGSRHWEKDSELNRIYLMCQQTYANNLLQARGHVFLNEVYDMLDVDRTKAGAVVGWVISDNGDNFIDFGIYEAMNARFVNGWERSILLDFNVDGVIYDKI
jgi:hypothetical protein